MLNEGTKKRKRTIKRRKHSGNKRGQKARIEKEKEKFDEKTDDTKERKGAKGSEKRN